MTNRWSLERSTARLFGFAERCGRRRRGVPRDCCISGSGRFRTAGVEVFFGIDRDRRRCLRRGRNPPAGPSVVGLPDRVELLDAHPLSLRDPDVRRLGATSAPQLSPVSVRGNFGKPFPEFSSSPDGRKALPGSARSTVDPPLGGGSPELSTWVSPKVFGRDAARSRCSGLRS